MNKYPIEFIREHFTTIMITIIPSLTHSATPRTEKIAGIDDEELRIAAVYF